MANSLTLTSPNYTQAEKNFFISDAIISLDTLNANLFYIAEDVKNDKYTFPKVVSTVVLQNRASIPTSSGTTILSNKDVNLGAFMGYTEFEPAVFENHWHVDQISSRMLDRGLPVTFENYLAGTYTAQNLAPIETMIWMGSTTYTASAAPGAANANYVFIDGIIKQCLTPATLALNTTNSGLTSANIIGYMEAMKNSLPVALLSKSDRYRGLKFIMSVMDAQKYEDALATTTYKNQDTTERGLNRYKGYDIIVVAGLPEHTMFFAWADNSVNSAFHMPVSSMDNMQFDLNRLQNNSTLWFYKILFKFGVGCSKPYEVAMCTNKTLASFNA